MPCHRTEQKVTCDHAVSVQAEAQAVESMLAYVLFHLETRKNFDHVVGILSLVLKVHASAISEKDELCQLARTIQEKLEAAWQRVDERVQSLRCLSSFFSEMHA
jgi:iron-sulfur cluster repair protein YtfE (RIC family)